MDPALRAMLLKTVNVRTVTAYTADGNETLAAAVAVPAYVEVKKSDSGFGSIGREAQVQHVVITEMAITMDQRVWLPGDDPTSIDLGKKPMAIDVFNDVLGNIDHYEVTL